IEEGPLLQVYRSRLRVPFTMFWAELTVHLYAQLPHARFFLAWGNSDPSSPVLVADPGEVEFSVRNVNVEIEFAQAKVLQTRHGSPPPLVLPRPRPTYRGPHPRVPAGRGRAPAAPARRARGAGGRAGPGRGPGTGKAHPPGAGPPRPTSPPRRQTRPRHPARD